MTPSHLLSQGQEIHLFIDRDMILYTSRIRAKCEQILFDELWDQLNQP